MTKQERNHIGTKLSNIEGTLDSACWDLIALIAQMHGIEKRMSRYEAENYSNFSAEEMAYATSLRDTLTKLREAKQAFAGVWYNQWKYYQEYKITTDELYGQPAYKLDETPEPEWLGVENLPEEIQERRKNAEAIDGILKADAQSE